MTFAGDLIVSISFPFVLVDDMDHPGAAIPVVSADALYLVE
jgi:hypothetical protein